MPRREEHGPVPETVRHPGRRRRQGARLYSEMETGWQAQPAGPAGTAQNLATFVRWGRRGCVSRVRVGGHGMLRGEAGTQADPSGRYSAWLGLT